MNSGKPHRSKPALAMKALGLALALIACAQSRESLSGPAAQGLPADAPPVQFQVKRYPGGEPFDIASERGNVVLLDVWATWCDPCREALPVYESLAHRYAERGLKVYALNMDENVRAVPAFLEEVKVSLPILLDTNSVAEKILKVENLPTTILIDRQGRVRYFHVNFSKKSAAKYQAEIEELLAEPAQ
jgi:thiol-disulfide isomerase/thioredoxin